MRWLVLGYCFQVKATFAPLTRKRPGALVLRLSNLAGCWTQGMAGACRPHVSHSFRSIAAVPTLSTAEAHDRHDGARTV